MACGARWGLKEFGDAIHGCIQLGLNGLWCPLGFERMDGSTILASMDRLNGLWCPLGFERPASNLYPGNGSSMAKWPVVPVGV